MPAKKKAEIEGQKNLPPIPDGWEEVGDRYSETMDLTDSDPLQGTYLGYREVETTDPQGRERVSKLHDFERIDPISGDLMTASVWGSYDLDLKLTEELKGQEVQVAYLKTIPIQGGKQDLKVFRVIARSG